MKNFEKYKNQNDLINAFFKNRSPSSISVSIVQEFVKWREMEAEEENILPCPFCGSSIAVYTVRDCQNRVRVQCACGYRGGAWYDIYDNAIAEHNHVARLVMEANKEGERK